MRRNCWPNGFNGRNRRATISPGKVRGDIQFVFWSITFAGAGVIIGVLALILHVAGTF
jgi:hypothetical protein